MTLKRMSLACLTCTVLMLSAVAWADDAPNVDDLIAKYLKAIGGKDKLTAIKTMKATGKSTFGGGMEAPMVMEHKRPNKVRMEFQFQGMTGTQAFDGKDAWMVMPFAGKPDAEKMPDDQRKEFEDQADIDGALVDYKTKGHKVEFVAKEDFGGKPAYAVKVSKKNGIIETHYLDAEKYLPVGMKSKRNMGGMEVEVEIGFGNYKEAGGVLMAHTIEQRMGGSTTPAMSINIEKMEINIDLPDNRFTMPETKKAEPAPEKKD